MHVFTSVSSWAGSQAQETCISWWPKLVNSLLASVCCCQCCFWTQAMNPFDPGLCQSFAGGSFKHQVFFRTLILQLIHQSVSFLAIINILLYVSPFVRSWGQKKALTLKKFVVWLRGQFINLVRQTKWHLIGTDKCYAKHCSWTLNFLS